MADNRPPPRGQVIPANRARQGDIVLRKPLRRAIFIAGLAGAMIGGVAFVILSYS
jgi:hypothetical protein